MQYWTAVLPILALSVVDAQRAGFVPAVKSTTSSIKTTTSSIKSSTSSIKTSTTVVAAGRAGFQAAKTTTSTTKSSTTSSKTSTTSTSTKPTTTFTSTKPTTTSTSIKTTTTIKPTTTAFTTTTSIKTTSTLPQTTTLQKITTTSSAPACTSTLPAYGCLPLTNQAYFVSKMLNQHNTYRMRHNAPNMTWNPDLVPAALANAQMNADKNIFEHTVNGAYGENIAYQYGYNNPEFLGFLWYDEERQYDFSKGDFAEATGHFTQVVWLSSTQLGCAYVQATNPAQSNNGWYYLSCEYNAPGNYYGQFQKEVLAPNSQPYPTQPPKWL